MKAEGKKLSVLLKNSKAKLKRGSADPIVNRLVIDSRRVTPGSLFFALPGIRYDGTSFVDEALTRGAVGVVSSVPRRFGNSKAVFVNSADPRVTLAKVARRFFGKPDKALALIGITGTNGKTTVSYLAKHFLSLDEVKTGCLGTIGYDLVERVLPSFRTTPEAHDLCELLAQMKGFGCERAVMEVSSHGIDQMRVADLRFDVGVFLNLTRDHLDYHGDMDSYFEVKRRFIVGDLGRRPKKLAINVDDVYGRRLAQELDADSLISFGTGSDAEMQAIDVDMTPDGTTFTLRYEGKNRLVRSPLIGHYNVSNVLAAMAISAAVGADLDSCIGSLGRFDGIPGRMERIQNGQPFEVVVDYAHTGNALENALSMLREIILGKLSVVFGCGGDRDRGKRSEMTGVSQILADRCWATTDNPRSEAQEQIFDDMREGVTDPSRIDFVLDRRRAIELALKSAEPGDCVLIAGKGHEPFQEFGDTVVPFDDRKVASELLELMKLGGRF
jgi:UDP-N-acetylmuramoyl-L-alanyl-D-glutamate--2,6-diaminopimelate ligase